MLKCFLSNVSMFYVFGVRFLFWFDIAFSMREVFTGEKQNYPPVSEKRSRYFGRRKKIHRTADENEKEAIRIVLLDAPATTAFAMNIRYRSKHTVIYLYVHSHVYTTTGELNQIKNHSTLSRSKSKVCSEHAKRFKRKEKKRKNNDRYTDK